MKNQRPETGDGQKVQSPDLVVLLEVEMALGHHQENVNLKIAQLENLFGVLVREANHQVADLTAAIRELNLENDHDHRTGAVAVRNGRDHDPRVEVVAENNIDRVYVVIKADFLE